MKTVLEKYEERDPIELEEIEFTRDEIPVSKKLKIDGVYYNLEIQYNEVGDFYTAVLYDGDYSPLLSTKLVYMGNVFFSGQLGVPSRRLIPLNITDLAQEKAAGFPVNYENFEEKIKLYLI